MDFLLMDEQKMVQETAMNFAQKNLLPLAADIDIRAEFPKSLFKQLGDSDLLGLMISPAYGGMGKGRLEAALCLEELGAVSASFAWSVAANYTAGFVIQAFGSEEQKKKYLPGLCRGELVAVMAVSEPASGTNWPMSLSTKAEKKGNQYIINGTKCFISNAGLADLYLTFARTDPSKGPGGISVFVIEKGTEGFTIGKKEDKLGLRGNPTGELVFENCCVSDSNLIAGEGSAMTIFSTFGALDSVSQASVFHGIARGTLAQTIKYIKERMVGGINKSLSNWESVQGAVSDMTIAVETMRLITYRGALTNPGPDPHPILSAKYCSETALSIVDRALSLHGGYGCSKDFPVERYYRDAKTLSMQKSFDFIRTAMGKMILGVPMG